MTILKTLRLASRKSLLAEWQTLNVKNQILRFFPDLRVEVVYCSTKGDEVLDRPLAEIGGKGLFIKTLEEALLKGEADIAVHSLKDVPSQLSPEFSLMAYVERENPLDVFLSKNFDDFSHLPLGAKVGTCSPRRTAQLKRLRPDLNIVLLRGNVPTRIQKILSGEMDAGILAYAGLHRLGLLEHVKAIFPAELLLPAPGQGMIAVECLASREQEFAFLSQVLNNPQVQKMAVAERSFSARLEGDCYSPIAALAERDRDQFTLKGAVLSRDGVEKFQGSKTILLAQDLSVFAELGVGLAEDLLKQGAGEVLKCH